jgi:hypothetical protein
LQSCSANMPTVWVYVMLFGIHIGQQMSSLSQDGLLPFKIRLSAYCALIEFARVALALLMILFIREVTIALALRLKCAANALLPPPPPPTPSPFAAALD